MIHKLDEKGFALLTVVLIGGISMALLSMVFAILTMSTTMSGMGKRYLTELESARGASEFVMASLRNASLTCIDNSGAITACTSSNQGIFLSANICTALGKTGCAGLTATFLSEASFTPENSSSAVTIYAVAVVSTAASATNETASVEFVYKTF